MIKPVLSDSFYHDGRGPELVRAIWGLKGIVLRGFEYYNPDDTHDEQNLKHLVLDQVQVFAVAGDEVHGERAFSQGSRAAIFKITDSDWKKRYSPRYLSDCEHYQIMFYDEIFDVLCRAIAAGQGAFPE